MRHEDRKKPYQLVVFSGADDDQSREAAASRALVAAGNVPKGVFIDPKLVNKLLREEVASRKELAERERVGRDDVEFLIAHARTDYRKRPDSPARRREERERPGDALDVILFEEHSPPRQPPPPIRPRPPQLPRVMLTGEAELRREESELRVWIERLEAKLRGPVIAAADESWAYCTRLIRCEAEELKEREEWWEFQAKLNKAIMKEEFLERPYGKWVKPRDLTFEEKEAVEREKLCEEEQRERKAAHDWLDMRYGVMLFSTARIEDSYRVDIMEEFEESLAQNVAAFFRVRYSTPLCAMAAFHGRERVPPTQNLTGLMAVAVSERGKWPTTMWTRRW